MNIPDIILDSAVAELEPHGLNVRQIDLIENKLGIIWLKDLKNVDERELMAVKEFGDGCMKRLKTSIECLARERSK